MGDRKKGTAKASKEPTESPDQLRRGAEARLAKITERLDEFSVTDLKKLVHELGTYRIELEMQNEELRRAQAELETSRAKYADLYEFAPQGYFTFDRQGLVKEVNLTGAKMLAVARSRLLETSLLACVVPADRLRFLDHLAAVFATATKQTGEIALRSGDGATFHVRLESLAVDGADGSADFCRTSMSDVTEGHQIEEALRKSENLFRLTAERCSEIIFQLDLQGRVDYVSPAVARYGFDPEELLYTGFSAYVLPADLPRALAAFRRAGSGEQIGALELRLLRKDGASYPAEITVVPIRSEGRVVGIQGISRDITERIKAEQKLRESEKKYRLLFENMAEGFALYELLYDDNGAPADWRVLETNAAYALHTGLAGGRILGRRVSELFPDAIVEYLPRFAEVVEKQRSIEFETYATPANRYLHVVTFPAGPNRFASTITDISMRKRAEAALLDNELRASALINSADESIWMFGLAGEILAANNTAARRMGLGVADVVGKNCRDLLPPALAAARMAKIEEIVRTGAPDSFEDERAGIIFEHTVYPVRDVSGAVTAVAVFSRDITERRQAELARERLTKELHQLATELDTVFAALPVLVSLHDRDGRYLRVNPAVKELFGIDPTHASREEVARRVRARFPDGRPLTAESMPSSRVLRGETVSGVEYLVDDAQGREHVMLFNAVPLHAEGQVSGMVLAQMDITEPKAAKEAWRQSQLDMARAQQVGQIGSWRLDVRRNVLTWSAENHRIFGIPEGTPLTYETFLAAIHPDDRDYVDCQWQAGLRGEPYDIEHRLVVDGQVKWVREKAYLEFGRDGSLLGGFGITQDITARKQAETEIRQLNEQLGRKVAELEAANRELEGFTYSVSHDLRAPIRHIAGFAKVLEMKIGAELNTEGHKSLAFITNAAEQLGVLVDKLLEFSRMGRTEFGIVEVDLGALITEVVEGFRKRSGSRRIEWRVGELPVVHGDPTMLRFVVENLIANAVKFTSTRELARIEIGHGEEESRYIISVSDNGVGFDMAHYDKLFGVFQRLHGQEEFAGTGIGLANVQRIIRRHGGEVWAESQVDQGATFFFALPREHHE